MKKGYDLQGSRSPRKRGCFSSESAEAIALALIPARAGVFLRSFRVLLND